MGIEAITDKYKLYNGDCLEVMKCIPDNSIDMVLCDLPYNVTRNNWDKNVIDLNELWKQYDRIVKDNGAIVLFGQDKFTAKLMMSNIKNHRYNLIWDKVLTTGFLNANRMPLRSHEDICIFYRKLPTYNPQFFKGKPNHNSKDGICRASKNTNNNYGSFEARYNNELGDNKHPRSILSFRKPHPSIAVHPTEKPIELLEYLIKTYSNENNTILDNCMGSGSTGVATLNTNRKFIGIELDKNYFDISLKRINGIEELLGDN